MLPTLQSTLASVNHRPALVKLRDLTKQYEEAGTSRIVLHAVNTEIREGEFAVLLGKSGSGKSTLLNLIGGIDVPTAGEVWIKDTCLTCLDERHLTLFRRDHIGFVFQYFTVIPTLTALENVSLPYELRRAGKKGTDKKEAEKSARNLLERVGLESRMDTYPDKLSGGEQQRVAIARALVHRPLLILADEPTGNLDEDTGQTVLKLLLELTRDAGKTLIMATHSPEVVPYANMVYHISEGKLVTESEYQKAKQR